MRVRTREERPSLARVSSANLAQLVEQCFRKAEVPGSTPGVGSMEKRLETCRDVFLVCLHVYVIRLVAYA